MKKSNKHIYYVSRFVVLLFWNILTWKIWSNIMNFRMQISLYSLSRNMDEFLAHLLKKQPLIPALQWLPREKPLSENKGRTDE